MRSGAGLNCVRNAGLDAAQGDLLAFCDCDDVVDRGWLEALVAGAADADFVGGLLDPLSLNSERALAWRPHEIATDLLDEVGFLPFVAGGNCAIWTDVARHVRWDESFRFGSSDQEFSWRVQRAGYRLSFAPNAIVRLRFRTRLRSLGRQYFASASRVRSCTSSFVPTACRPARLATRSTSALVLRPLQTPCWVYRSGAGVGFESPPFARDGWPARSDEAFGISDTARAPAIAGRRPPP